MGHHNSLAIVLSKDKHTVHIHGVICGDGVGRANSSGVGVGGRAIICGVGVGGRAIICGGGGCSRAIICGGH
eukprot:10261082-Ditylum_brightwellii.AAC.1